MPDNNLFLRVPHTLGRAEAKRRIGTAATEAKARPWQYLHASDLDWHAYRLNFRATALGQTIEGTIDIEREFVELRAQLPFVIRTLANRIMPILRDTGQKLLR
jgi:hypothetical protein